MDNDLTMKNKRKVFILDTSVLLYDKCSIHSFRNNNVVIPIVVLDELDRFKDKKGTKPRNELGEREIDELEDHRGREGKKQDWIDSKDRMTEQEMKTALFGEGQGYGEKEDLEDMVEQKGGENFRYTRKKRLYKRRKTRKK